jgi:uncharacterized protein DUF3617
MAVKERSFMTSSRAAASFAAVLVICITASAGAQAHKGDLWETTSQPSMEGAPFKMPSSTMKVCSAKEWKEPPGGQKNCKTSNMKIEGPKVTWDIQCTGPSMSGHGEIIRDDANAYNGTIKLTGGQGNMTINLSGKRLGECDNPQ